MKNTIQQILALITDQKWINRNTVSGTLPPRELIVSLLAKRGVQSQTTSQIVTEADWRDADFGRKLSRDYLYVWLADEAGGEHAAAVFDYANSEFSYC